LLSITLVQLRLVVVVVLFQRNMLYQALKNHFITIDPKESQDLDAQNGVVLVPQSGAKVFLHWLTDSGKIRSTYTMTYATRVEGKVKLINGLDTQTSIHVIQLA
jgi:hypothetical protein